MKRFSIVFRLIALAACILLLTNGLCPGDDDKDSDRGGSLAGAWELTEMTIYNVPDVGTLHWTSASPFMPQMTLVLRDNGTFTFTIVSAGVTEVEEGTWTAGSGTITMDNGEETMTAEYTLNGDVLLMEIIMPMDFDEDGVDENYNADWVFERT